MDDRKRAAQDIVRMGATSVVMKGGHGSEDDVVDLFFDGETFVEMTSPRIDTRHTHGTGCTFSAAITAELAKGVEIKQAVLTAKDFTRAAIETGIRDRRRTWAYYHWAYKKRGVKSF